jgi:NAD+ synthase
MFDAKAVKNQIIDWIRDYYTKFGASQKMKAVVGISGGKDSSVVAALCAEALGRDRVLGVLMPQGEQDDIGISYALCEELGIAHIEINIGESVRALYAEIEKTEQTLNAAVTSNTPARVRMATLYAVSAMALGLVANTCNLSEDWVGYSTKFGDSAGDFSPLSDLTASEVKEVGRALGLPEVFVDKVPADGMCGKTDEENLGFTYAALDRYIRDGVCGDEAVKANIDRRHAASRHKLEPMPCFRLKG